jgi:phenylpropionate dioxygenase-like ring-hydroxylating dioxygenase large terminal subunit
MLSKVQIESITAPLGSAKTLPPVAYTSADVFRAECEHIFASEWLCVARQEQLPNAGDYRRVDIVGQPLILVRLEDHTLHAMSAVCAHRGMPVVEGAGNTTHFQCPYHAWRYDLQGSLASTPLMQGVEIDEDCKLPEVKVETWNDFVFVNLDVNAEPLGSRLATLNEITKPFQMDDLVWVSSSEWDCPWNWKILVENFMEAYHHLGPHLQSIQPLHAAKNSYVSGSVDEGWSVLHMPPREEPEADDATAESLAGVIMPCFCWLNLPGTGATIWYQLFPKSHDQMKLLLHVMLPKHLAESSEAPEITEFVQKIIDDIHREDIAVNEGPWLGLNSPLAQAGPLSLLEESIWQLNQWWLRRVSPKVGAGN